MIFVITAESVELVTPIEKVLFCASKMEKLSKYHLKRWMQNFAMCFVVLILCGSIQIVCSASVSLEQNQLCTTSDCIMAAADLLESMNFEADPCEDFYEFTCGNWGDFHPRPVYQNSWSWTNIMEAKIEQITRTFLESKPGANEPKAITLSRTLYRSCMNSTRQVESGKKFILESLSWLRFQNIRWMRGAGYGFPDAQSLINGENAFINKLDWIRTFPVLNKAFGVNPFFGYDVLIDSKNETRVILTMQSFDSIEINNVKEYISLLYPDIHSEDLNDLSEKIVNMTDVLVAVQIKSSEIKGAYDILECTDDLLNIYFDDVLKHANLTSALDKVLFWSRGDEYFFKRIVHTLNLNDLELFTWWTVIESLVGTIGYDYDFYYNCGTECFYDYEHDRNKPIQSKYCTRTVENYMGVITSYAFVKTKKEFHDVTKPKLLDMFEKIRASFRLLLENNNWLDEKTKRSVQGKADAMIANIGFPEWLLDNDTLNDFYGDLEFDENWLLMNLIKLRLFEMEKNLQALNFTDMQWNMLAPVRVNAQNDYFTNIITIPLAQLQFPFYNLGIESLNYGTSVIGHEFSHAFDYSGRNYDEAGNWNNQWTPESDAEYDKRAKCLIKQYDGFNITEINTKVNGTKTLDENIADNLGLLLTYQAYEMHVTEHGEDKMLPGFEKFSRKQLFFIGYGNQWCGTHTPEGLKQDALTDEHTINKFRVNGVVANSVEFQAAFMCKTGSKMISKEPCQIF